MATYKLHKFYRSIEIEETDRGADPNARRIALRSQAGWSLHLAHMQRFPRIMQPTIDSSRACSSEKI